MHRWIARFFVVLALLTVAAPAGAQFGTDQITNLQYFDPSIEAAGMGGASIAAFWMDNPNDRANPALMGFHRGLRYSYGTTKVAPQLSEDIRFTSHRILAGAWGVGIAMNGKPIESVGRLRFDYGEATATDSLGNEIGTVEAHEDVRSFALGISVFDLISSVLEATGKDPLGWRHRVSLALGHTWKTYETEITPPIAFHGEGDQKDAGALIRIAPYDQIGDGLYETSDHVRCRIELAGAYSRLNYLDDGEIVYDNGSTDVLAGQGIIGGSAQLTLALANGGMVGLQDFITPTIRLGLTYETGDLYVDGENLGNFSKRAGLEASVMDILYFRYGRLFDDFLVGDESTVGAGLQLRYKNAIGVRGDWASYPQSTFLGDHFDRWGINFFVDPYRLMKMGE